MAERPAIVWFRQDLRLTDNPALTAAVGSGAPLVLLYVLDDETPGAWRMGGASRWWLHRSLEALSRDLAPHGARLILRTGRADLELIRVVQEVDAGAVYWNRCYEPYAIVRDSALKESLRQVGVVTESFNSALLFEPWEVRTKSGEPFKVFTPFWRACLAQSTSRALLPRPKHLRTHARAPPSDPLSAWKLTPHAPNWAASFESEWKPGEAGAAAALRHFAADKLAAYASERDNLGRAATSRLSPHLHFGEISPMQVWGAISDAPGAAKFQSELGWREFSYHLLYQFPRLPSENWRASFDAFPWREDAPAFRAWRRGKTGYPVVDAAMRELWITGAMHNRARMIAASFLIKHLLIDWRRGAAHFWDTLCDADLANNSASWQWVAGCGADAAPYFRIFNPVAQGRRYDADGAYVRRWLPELARLAEHKLHAPWEASDEELRAAGVRLGENYPHPIVEHAAARARALAAFESLSSKT